LRKQLSTQRNCFAVRILRQTHTRGAGLAVSPFFYVFILANIHQKLDVQASAPCRRWRWNASKRVGRPRLAQLAGPLRGTGDMRVAAKALIATFVRNEFASEPQKRRPPCRHGGLESREETPKEGICGRSCRTAAISSLTASVARAFFIKNEIAVFHSAPDGREHPTEISRLAAAAGAESLSGVNFAFGHRRFKRGQAVRGARAKLSYGGGENGLPTGGNSDDFTHSGCVPRPIGGARPVRRLMQAIRGLRASVPVS
jgi:hypothetical protein